MLRWLWWRVTALVMSHCHGFYPNSQFCAQLQRYHGMDAVGGERAPTAASDASRGPMMLMRHWRVHSGAPAQSGNYWPHLRDRGNNPFTTGTLSHQTRINVLHSLVAGGRAGTQSVSCCLKICQRGTGNGQSLYIWQDRTTDPLSLVQKKLIRALPPWPRWKDGIWLRESFHSPCNNGRPSPPAGVQSCHALRLHGAALTYRPHHHLWSHSLDESRDGGSHPHCVSCFSKFSLTMQERKALSKKDWRKIFLNNWIVSHLMLLYSRRCCKSGKFKLCFASSFPMQSTLMIAWCAH